MDGYICIGGDSANEQWEDCVLELVTEASMEIDVVHPVEVEIDSVNNISGSCVCFAPGLCERERICSFQCLVLVDVANGVRVNGSDVVLLGDYSVYIPGAGSGSPAISIF